MLTNRVSRLNVVGVSILREARSLSLLRREETLLSNYNLVEIFGSLSPHNTILQLICSIVLVLCDETRGHPLRRTSQ